MRRTYTAERLGVPPTGELAGDGALVAELQAQLAARDAEIAQLKT